ncbi:energy transducer TonB [Kaistella sp.]|uniref:energy transducer TonB n=2 Tax=Kaistella sp. TaxID=2782235 RepID=UPI002F92DA52
MSKKLVYLMLLVCANLSFAQQNDEFRSAKDYFDYQRFMLNSEFKKKFDNEKDITQKIAIKKDFSEFMVKLDSIQNTAFIGTLIKVKNREDLEKINVKNLPELRLNPKKEDLNKEAQYPGGFETLRKQIADLFYTDSVLPDQKLLKTNVVFVVEKDGSIANVQAQGENFTFNRQAEIAMYLLPEKFSPAIINGTPVRYRFRLPLSMSFD